MMIKNFSNWTIRDLVIIGIISALARALGLVTVFAFGGMNPLSLSLRTAVVTVLYIILRHKVTHFGTLILAVLIGAIVSFFIMAQSLIALPWLLASALVAELIIIWPGRNSTTAIVLGVGFMQIMERLARLLLAYITMRENAAMIWPLVFMSIPSLIGAILACLFGPKFIKELRHAGFINN